MEAVRCLSRQDCIICWAGRYRPMRTSSAPRKNPGLFRALSRQRQHGVLVGARRHLHLGESARRQGLGGGRADAQGRQSVCGQTFRQLHENARACGARRTSPHPARRRASGLSASDGKLRRRFDPVERTAAHLKARAAETFRQASPARPRRRHAAAWRLRRRPALRRFRQRLGIAIGVLDFGETRFCALPSRSADPPRKWEYRAGRCGGPSARMPLALVARIACTPSNSVPASSSGPS